MFLAVYLAVTPYNELALIRQGNVAAAISLAGAIIGFVLPLARAVTQSVSALDLVAWGVVALVVQVVVFFLVGKLVPRFAEAVRNGQVAGATFLAALAVAVGAAQRGVDDDVSAGPRCRSRGLTPDPQDYGARD